MWDFCWRGSLGKWFVKKMMQVSRIHDIMECKNFYERKLTMNLKDYIAKHWKLSTRGITFRDIMPLMADSLMLIVMRFVKSFNTRRIRRSTHDRWSWSAWVHRWMSCRFWVGDGLRLFVSLVSATWSYFCWLRKRIRCGYPLHARRCHQTRPTRPHRWWPFGYGWYR